MPAVSHSLPAAGLPCDAAQWLALALALVVMAGAPALVRPWSRPRRPVAILATVAAALSAGYVAVYLRGGPRIIDATSYYLEARALSAGLLSFPLPAPEPSVLGRFLVRHAEAGAARAAVIFPPGYPAVLALGFLARAPLAVGPVIAAAIAAATFDLGDRIARGLRLPAAPSAAQIAILLSVVCAALRYHTADTMSHGLAALCFVSALALVLRAADAGRARRAALLAAGAGLAAGLLFATRPVSTLALAAALAFILARDPPARAAARRLVPALLLGALPGALLFLAHQRAATGAWGASSQRLYYALGDGPPGCFRYGFGAGIGCVGEHGDFVRAHLAGGYGLLAAAGTTLRRLKAHLVDPANLEPLALLVPAGAFVARGSARGRALGVATIAQILAYAPFYFDGNYPGGGGRFFCDLLPVEHVLAAIAVVAFAARRRAPERWAAGAVALALAGFAFRAGLDHASLRDRDGGRPFFEPAELARAGVTRGLVFLDSDHGFDLAYDPAARPGGVEVARFHGDALDRMTWEARGRPPAYRYRVVIPEGGGPASVALEPLVFPPVADRPQVIEGESLWPAIEQRGGYALPEWAAGTCASAGRILALHHEAALAEAAPAAVTLTLPARWLAGRSVTPRVAASGGARGTIEIRGPPPGLRRAGPARRRHVPGPAADRDTRRGRARGADPPRRGWKPGRPRGAGRTPLLGHIACPLSCPLLCQLSHQLTFRFRARLRPCLLGMPVRPTGAKTIDRVRCNMRFS